MKQCPIKIIEENVSKGGNKYERWIALSRDIDYENNRYHNVNEYLPKKAAYKTLLDKGFFWRLFYGTNPALISELDIIRNPTMEELIEISNAAKAVGIKINLKTGKYIGTLK
jgi:hypothetical protein